MGTSETASCLQAYDAYQTHCSQTSNFLDRRERPIPVLRGPIIKSSYKIPLKPLASLEENVGHQNPEELHRQPRSL